MGKAFDVVTCGAVLRAEAKQMAAMAEIGSLRRDKMGSIGYWTVASEHVHITSAYSPDGHPGLKSTKSN
jgi:hypothetical protein